MRNALRKLTPGNSLAAVAEELGDLERAREAAIQRGFRVLEERHAAVAQLVLQSIGDRQRGRHEAFRRRRGAPVLHCRPRACRRRPHQGR
jgi:hypothetical protein